MGALRFNHTTQQWEFREEENPVINEIGPTGQGQTLNESNITAPQTKQTTTAIGTQVQTAVPTTSTSGPTPASPSDSRYFFGNKGDYYKVGQNGELVSIPWSQVPDGGREAQSLSFFNPPLPEPEAPSSVDEINTVGEVTLPDTEVGSGSVSNATASTAGFGAQLDALISERTEANAQFAGQQQQLDTQNQSFIQKLFDSPSPADIRADAQAQTGITPANYFADQRASIAEIGTLTQEYNAVKAQRDAQIAQTNDKLGSMNFINNQVQQINRNAAPVLNEMSANINAKTAVMQAERGLFQEAQSFVNQAVQDATADLKYQVDLFNAFNDVNQGILDRMESRYNESFNFAWAMAEAQYNEAQAEKSQVGELMINNPKAGIRISDSLDQAITKVASLPAASSTIDDFTLSAGQSRFAVNPETGLVEEIASVAPKSSGGSGGSSESGNLTEAVLNGFTDVSTLTPTNRGIVTSNIYGMNDAPEWFVDREENAALQTLHPSVVQNAWDEFRRDILNPAANLTPQELDRAINQQISTPEFQALEIEQQRSYIRSQGADPGDYGI